MTDPPRANVATRVVLSFAPPDDLTADALDERSYRSYLRRKRRGAVAPGEKWEEFVNCGCGITRDVVLRVESMSGGDSIGAETTFVFEPREG